MRLSPAAVRRVVAVLVVLHLLGWAALALVGVGLWRTYCEGFGCIGLEIAWMAWAVAYAALLALGLGLGLWRRPDAGLRRLRGFLKPGGAFALWSNDDPEEAFLGSTVVQVSVNAPCPTMSVNRHFDLRCGLMYDQTGQVVEVSATA